MKRITWRIIILIGLLILLMGGIIVWMLYYAGGNLYEVDQPITAKPDDCSGETTRFAVIGDFGQNGSPAEAVAQLIETWQVDFIVTVGDNNYMVGSAETIDKNIGQYYQAYIHPYQGEYGPGATENRFFPALGNHDWDTGNVQAHLDYFTLPGNERYYEVIQGPAHLFIVDSDPREPDGRTPDSLQGQWLKQQLSHSSSPWQLLFMHHPPYSSSARRGSDIDLQWPFADWGVDAIVTGHDHFYERSQANGIPYIVNGLGGFPIRYRFGISPNPESVVRYNRDYGAMLITVNQTCLNLSFYNVQQALIDSYTVRQ